MLKINQSASLISYNYTPNNKTTFGNKISIPYSKKAVLAEKSYQKFELFARKVINKISFLSHKKKLNNYHSELMAIDESSEKYLFSLFSYGKKISGKMAIDVNVESNRLKKIMESNEACIFIINHDNQRKDAKMLGFFNALLAREYILNNKSKVAPRPKVILNEDILKAANTKLQAIMKKMGFIGIDANLFDTNMLANGKKLIELLNGFKKDANHIFIFPEGKMCMFKGLDLKYKFQTGIADFIKQASARKERVKVVPLGFGYKNNESSIHIGESIYFKKSGGKILTTKGNVNSSYALDEYKKFFSDTTSNEEFKAITKDGQPVNLKEVPDYIAGILCENLKICVSESKHSLLKQGRDNTIYNIGL